MITSFHAVKLRQFEPDDDGSLVAPPVLFQAEQNAPLGILS